MSNPENDSAIQARDERTEGEPIDQPRVPSQPPTFLPTLPRKFKSLLDASIKIDCERPRDIIELLGNALGIVDYETNMPAFWFLDTIAFHVLRYRKGLDDYYLTVLISWLTGEMTLIRDRKYFREEFFEEIKEIFNMAADKVSEEKRLPYWEEIVKDIDTESIDEEAEEFSAGKKESEEYKPEDSTKRYLQEIQSSNNEKATENISSTVSKENMKFASNINPIEALNAVIESTYSMYANELRYDLVYSVFVEPIEVKIYRLPFVLRTPRPVKFAESGAAPFNVQFRNSIKSKLIGQRKRRGRKTTDKGKSRLGPSGVPVTPPSSLTDEESLKSKRQFILPLIEANEASEMFEEHTEGS